MRTNEPSADGDGEHEPTLDERRNQYCQPWHPKELARTDGDGFEPHEPVAEDAAQKARALIASGSDATECGYCADGPQLEDAVKARWVEWKNHLVGCVDCTANSNPCDLGWAILGREVPENADRDNDGNASKAPPTVAVNFDNVVEWAARAYARHVWKPLGLDYDSLSYSVTRPYLTLMRAVLSTIGAEATAHALALGARSSADALEAIDRAVHEAERWAGVLPSGDLPTRIAYLSLNAQRARQAAVTRDESAAMVFEAARALLDVIAPGPEPDAVRMAIHALRRVVYPSGE